MYFVNSYLTNTSLSSLHNSIPCSLLEFQQNGLLLSIHMKGVYRVQSMYDYMWTELSPMCLEKKTSNSPGSWRVGTALLMVIVDFDATDMPLIT